MCGLNTGLKIYDLLKENVRQDLKNETVQGEEEKNSAKHNKAEDVFELVKEIKINPTNLQVINADKQEETIELAFMFLNNLTSTEAGQKHLVGEDEKTKFIIIESIFGMFCYFSKNTAFDFVSNIVANMACLHEGRKFMVEHKYIEAIVV